MLRALIPKAYRNPLFEPIAPRFAFASIEGF